MSQSCHAHLFFGVCSIQQNSRFEIFFFFFGLIFFPVFYELACQNIQEKIWQTQRNTLNNRFLQLCVLSCILFIQNQVPYFKAVNDSNLTHLLLRKKKKKKKKPVKKPAFRSGPPICHELWDSIYFFSLTKPLHLKWTVTLMAHNWQKWKSIFFTCHCHKIYRVGAVVLSINNYTLKITILVNMWNLEQFRKKLIFCK